MTQVYLARIIQFGRRHVCYQALQSNAGKDLYQYSSGSPFFLCTRIRDNSGSHRRNGLFELTASGFRLEAAVTAAKRTERLFSCSHFCLAVSSCRSFNYNPLENLCEILSRTQQDVGADKLKFGSGWQLYRPTLSKVTLREKTIVNVI